MGRIYTDLGQEDKALDLLNQALPFWRAIPSRAGEAETLNNIGKVYNNLGQHDAALKYLNQSLSDLARSQCFALPTPSAGNTSPRPCNIHARAKLHRDCQHQRRSQHARQPGPSLVRHGRRQAGPRQLQSVRCPSSADLGERNGEALVLNDMGPAYAALARNKKLSKPTTRPSRIWRELGNRQGEALTLNNIGRLYRDLGQHQTALDYYNQALPIWREVGNRSGEALALSDIGRAYADLGQPAKALDFASPGAAHLSRDRQPPRRGHGPQ